MKLTARAQKVVDYLIAMEFPDRLVAKDTGNRLLPTPAQWER
jgi:hypothetical protein